MKFTLSAAVAALVLSLPTPSVASTWQIDSSHSNAQFAVRHLVVSKVRGSLGTVTGKMVLDEADPAKSTLEATVEVGAVNTGNADRDEHLRAADYLDTEKFPTLGFKSKRAENKGEGRWAVTGDLTLKGVTREVVLDVEGSSTPIKDPWGKTRLGGVARTTLQRSDFAIGGQKAMEGGGLVMGNDVEVTIDIELVRIGD